MGAGLLQYDSPRSILFKRDTTSVVLGATRAAIDLGMLGCVDEGHSLITLVTSPPYDNLILTRIIPNTIQFLYEAMGKELPPGVEKLDKAGLDSLEQELNERLPYLADGVDVVNGSEEDYETLQKWIQDLEANDPWVDATTGFSAMRLSSGLAGLLNLALHLQKPRTVTDQIMSRIAGRVHANQQAEYLSLIRPAWLKYFLSGWLRENIGLPADSKEKLHEYAGLIRDAIKKRLEMDGPLKPVDEFKHMSMQEMLAELDRNTVPYKDTFKDYGRDWNDDDEQAVGPNTILRKPATAAQVAAAENTIGRPLPNDLKEFYALTNGTRAVVEHYPWFHNVQERLLPVERLFWEDAEYMHDYKLDLLPSPNKPVEIEWPGIEGGAIAMYEHDGQGTDYVWYVGEELLSKARKSLEDAYEAATAEEKKGLDDLVRLHHGSWEKLRGLKQCWYQQSWGDPDSMIVFHDFRAFLSKVVSTSVLDENKNPIRKP